MTKVGESSTTAWLETIRGFFISDEEIENEDNIDNKANGYQEWKKANADIIDEKAITNLEKMLEHKDKKKRESTKTSVVEKAETKVVKENNNKENIHENIGYEQEH